MLGTGCHLGCSLVPLCIQNGVVVCLWVLRLSDLSFARLGPWEREPNYNLYCGWNRVAFIERKVQLGSSSRLTLHANCFGLLPQGWFNIERSHHSIHLLWTTYTSCHHQHISWYSSMIVSKIIPMTWPKPADRSFYRFGCQRRDPDFQSFCSVSMDTTQSFVLNVPFSTLAGNVLILCWLASQLWLTYSHVNIAARQQQ